MRRKLSVDPHLRSLAYLQTGNGDVVRFVDHSGHNTRHRLHDHLDSPGERPKERGRIFNVAVFLLVADSFLQAPGELPPHSGSFRDGQRPA